MKKAQIELQFNWIFILIAGAAILFFFFTLISQQRTVSEERLQRDVTRIIENIFVGAGVSEKTKNLIAIPPQYEFSFTCDDEKNIRQFGITGSDASVELPQEPIFAPATLQGTRLITWSLPVQLPYKIADILLVTAPTIKYVMVADENDLFWRELDKDVHPSGVVEPEQPSRVAEGLNFNARPLDPQEWNQADVELGKNHHLRFVFLQQPGNLDLPARVRDVPDNLVSAVTVTGGSITYYKKQGTRLVHTGDPLPLLYAGSGKQSLRFAAIFAADAESYTCNVRKVLARMEKVTRLYQDKITQLKEYYGEQEPPSENCRLKSEQVEDRLESLATAVKTFNAGGEDPTLERILATAQAVADETHHPQTGLSKICPITLY